MPIEERLTYLAYRRQNKKIGLFLFKEMSSILADQ
jgi:hypothetical protein